MDNQEPTMDDAGALSPLKQAAEMTDRILATPGIVTGKRRQIAIAAVAGLCLVLLSTLGSMAHWDTALTVALYGFAVGIPCLAAEFYVSTIPFEEPKGFRDTLLAVARFITFRLVADVVGFVGAFVGIVAYFWHLDPDAGKVFFWTIPALVGGFFAVLSVGAGVYFVRWLLRGRASS
jgi:hypothetical protein